MLGAADTINGPDVAPTGIVKTILKFPHEVTGIGAPFRSNTLPPCVTPKLLPSIATSLPTEAVVGDKPLITGAGDAVELIETLSRFAASRYPFPLTTRPMYTVCAIGTVVLASCVQLTPSDET